MSELVQEKSHNLRKVIFFWGGMIKLCAHNANGYRYVPSFRRQDQSSL